MNLPDVTKHSSIIEVDKLQGVDRPAHSFPLLLTPLLGENVGNVRPLSPSVPTTTIDHVDIGCCICVIGFVVAIVFIFCLK
jgi:hypothetical protein